MNEYQWNVLNEEEFDTKLKNVFEMVAKAIKTTLGPYGSQVIIDRFGETHITKDGWSVLQKLRFNDEKMVLNSILHLLQSIAGPVVATVGDGSSSSIAISDYLYKLLKEDPVLATLRPKDRQDLLKEACEEICNKIQQNATTIDRDGNLEEIYKLAHVSTNGNDEVAGMIRDIYLETKNPTIQYKEAKGSETHVDIIEGYKAKIYLRDLIFINNDAGDACVIEKPLIIMFDHRVDREIYAGVIEKAREKARSINKRLVVIAPYYSKSFDMRAMQEVGIMMRMHNNTDVVYCGASTSGEILGNEYSDFAVLCGCRLFTELDFQRFKEREDALYEFKINPDTPLDPKFEEDIPIDEFIGEVGSITIGARDTTISGLYNKDDVMYDKHYRDAMNKYIELRDRNRSLNIIDIKENDLKHRVSKLSGKMGTIYVGGNTGIERRANYDLVEDAVRAAESAYTYGYNVGGSIAIVRAVLSFLEHNDRTRETFWDVVNSENMTDCAISDVKTRTYIIIALSAVKTYRDVLENKFKDSDDTVSIIINESIDRGVVYNLITDKYDGDIINSCKTDIEILRAAASIVSLLMSSSLFLSINPEAGSTH